MNPSAAEAGRRGTGALALVLLASSVVAWTVAVALALARPENTEPFAGSDLLMGSAFLAFPAVGAVIAWKRPRNVLGWLFLVMPLLVAVGVLLSEWVLVEQEAASPWLVYAADIVDLIGFALLAGFILPLFPTGRYPGPAWRILGVFAAIGIVGSLTSLVLQPCAIVVLEPLGAPSCSDPPAPWFIRFPNPMGLDASIGQPIADFVGTFMIFALLGGVLSLLYRYRRGAWVEREQLRWLLAVVLIIVATFLLMGIAEAALGWDVELASTYVVAAGLIAIPTAVGIAILRYRLYDIGRIINRTFTYTVVAAVVVIMFAIGGVWVPTRLPTANNSFAVAATTLAVAAMFNPLRRRVQRLVDRRFNRATYDAGQVADHLSKRLRDQVDPTAIAEYWADVVDHTLQPASLGTWLNRAHS
jgi:hypothetical protein